MIKRHPSAYDRLLDVWKQMSNQYCCPVVNSLKTRFWGLAYPSMHAAKVTGCLGLAQRSPLSDACVFRQHDARLRDFTTSRNANVRCGFQIGRLLCQLAPVV
jgi:hypothetical protein